MSRINASMVLPGGWHYKDAAGYRIPLSGELPGPNEVVAELLDYRLENKLPVGDPQADMEAYVCANFKTWCLGGVDNSFMNHPANSAPPTLRWVDVISMWSNRLYEVAGSLKLVPLGEAEQRSEICRGCPMQKPWEHECPACVQSALRVLIILRQGRDVSRGNKLQSCACHGFCTRTAIHLEREHLGPVSEVTPGNCWLR